MKKYQYEYEVRNLYQHKIESGFWFSNSPDIETAKEELKDKVGPHWAIVKFELSS